MRGRFQAGNCSSLQLLQNWENGDFINDVNINDIGGFFWKCGLQKNATTFKIDKSVSAQKSMAKEGD